MSSLIDTFKRWPLLSIYMFKDDPFQSKTQENEVKLVKQNWDSDNEYTYFAEYYPMELCIKLVRDKANLNDLSQYNQFKTNNDTRILETISLSKTDVVINKLKAAIKELSISFKYCKFGINYKPETVKFQIKLLNEEDVKELVGFLKKHVDRIISSQSTENTLNQNDINLEMSTPSLYHPPSSNNAPFYSYSNQGNLSNYILSPFIEGKFNNQSNHQNYSSIYNNGTPFNPNHNLSHPQSNRIVQDQEYLRNEEKQLLKIQDEIEHYDMASGIQNFNVSDRVTNGIEELNKIKGEQNKYIDEDYILQELKIHLQSPTFKEYVDKVEKVILKMTKE